MRFESICIEATCIVLASEDLGLLYRKCLGISSLTCSCGTERGSPEYEQMRDESTENPSVSVV